MEAKALLVACFLLMSCLAYRTARRYIAEDSSLHNVAYMTWEIYFCGLLYDAVSMDYIASNGR
jgi:hypothetical protein